MRKLFVWLCALIVSASLSAALAQQRAPLKYDKTYDPTAAAAAATNALIAAEAQAKPSPTPATAAKTFLWEVKSKSNTVYLFGTVHVGKSDFYPLAPVIEDAFKKSKKIVVEADITKAENAKEIDDLIAYAAPDSLDTKISAPLYERLRTQLTRIDYPIDGLKTMKPFIVGGFLAVKEFTRLGYDMKYGVDSYLITRAQKEKKPLLELESQLGQIKLLSEMSPAQQEAFLENAIVSAENGAGNEQVSGMVKAWRTGDTQLMEDVVKASSANGKLTEELNEILIYGRHPEILKKVEGYLAANEAHFVAIGSLHLLGPRGLVDLLRAKGYQVRQL